jgi:hypothetical protein
MNILMIALPYHSYTMQIAEELRNAGHAVNLHDIQPRDILTKSLRNISPRLWQARMDQHHRAILEEERGRDYDLVLFIQVHQMRRDMLEAFRAEFGAAKFHLYNWDSIDNHDYRPYVDLFDSVLTFDPDDALREDIEYLPLFCLREFQGLRKVDQHEKAVYFVGNLVKISRYAAFRSFMDYCERNEVRLRSHLKSTPPVLIKLLRSGHWPRGVAYDSIDRGDFISMMERSLATFDFANHQQSGYTMRVIENLCAGKKIITNNARVLGEKFYSPDRFHVFQDLDFEGVKAFLDVPLSDPELDFPEYHIQAFARHLVEGKGHDLPRRVGARPANG